MEKVRQWGRYERKVKNPFVTKNEYYNVTLDVTFRRPDGSRIKFWGFYDGGHIWKIRCMPDQIGVWTYEAKFSDDTMSFSGSFDCVESDIPGMIHKEDGNPIWFGFKGGKHIILRSFHVGDRFFADNWPEEDRNKFLDWIQEQGYNTLSIASHYLRRDDRNRGEGWDIPKLWPLDAEEYGKMEKILDNLAQRRIIVFPFGGFFGRRSYYPTCYKDQEAYIRYTYSRIGVYWNILLNVGGPEPLAPGIQYMTIGEVDRLGNLIQSYNTFGHLLTVHNRPNGIDEFKNKTYTDFGTLQGPKTTNRKNLNRELLEAHHDDKPLYAQETLWPGNRIGHPAYTDDDIRKNAFVIMMSATAVNYADMAGNSSTGFSGTLNIEDANQPRHDIIKKVWDFFETVPYYRMVPRQDLISNGYCLAEVGKEYLIYLEDGGNVDVDVEEGTFRIVWISAKDTIKKIEQGVTETGKGLAAPDNHDWILHMVRV